MAKECQLYERKCVSCGECLMCDLDPKKKCNNCAKCIDEPEDNRTLYLDDFMTVREAEELLLEEKKKEKKTEG